MVKPTLLTIWPRAFDFPIWRRLVSKHKDLFERIVVVCTDSSVQRDLRPFFKEQMSFVDFINVPNPPVDENWYQNAVNTGLNEINSEWVLFLEQDFWFREGFLEALFNRTSEFDFACLQQGPRLHLACFLAKKEMIDKTHRYFGQIRDRVDCFDLFTMEMTILAKYNYKNLENLGFLQDKDYRHLNGLTQNTHLLAIGETPNFNPEEFKQYCRDSILCGNIYPDFKKLFEDYLNE